MISEASLCLKELPCRGTLEAMWCGSPEAPSPWTHFFEGLLGYWNYFKWVNYGQASNFWMFFSRPASRSWFFRTCLFAVRFGWDNRCTINRQNWPKVTSGCRTSLHRFELNPKHLVPVQPRSGLWDGHSTSFDFVHAVFEFFPRPQRKTYRKYPKPK